MSTRAIALAISFALFTPAIAMADGDEAHEREIILQSRNWETAQSYRLDLSVPEAPAFAMLGLDSPEVASPRDMPALALELANLFDDDGTLKPGVALTAQPYWLGGRRLTLSEYVGAPRPQGWPSQMNYRRVGALERGLLARTQVSAASAEVQGAEDAVRLGLGIVFHPFDSLDPRIDRVSGDEVSITTCLNRARDTLAQQTIGDAVVRARVAARNQIKGEHGWTDAELDAHLATDAVLQGTLDDLIQDLAEMRPDGGVRQFQVSRTQCVAAWRARQARQPNFMIAIGQTYLSETGKADDIESEGAAAWVGYSHPLRIVQAQGYTSRLNLYARYAEEEEVATTSGNTAPASVGVAAVSINLMEQRNWQFGLEAAYRTEDFSDATEDREFTQVALNGALRVNDGLWLRASYGTRGEEDDEFVRISFVVAQRAPD